MSTLDWMPSLMPDGFQKMTLTMDAGGKSLRLTLVMTASICIEVCHWHAAAHLILCQQNPTNVVNAVIYISL